MGKWINADYIKAVMKGDRLMQGNCEYELWKQEVDKKVDAMPGIEVMDVVTAYQQGWCDALDASVKALNDAKSQLADADRKTEPQTETDRPQGEWKGYNADKEDWLRDDGTPVFLVCDKCYGTVINNGSAHWNYCPNCGARMKGADDE